ncbi:MAG: isoamylase early set domain-containing protein [Gemmatimonadota bacterium]
MMDDHLAPEDSLRRVVQALHHEVPMRPGLPDRTRARGRRQRRIRVTATVLGLAVVTLALEPKLDGRQQVTFALDRPSAGHVALVGDFTDWRTDRLTMAPRQGGGWEMTLRLRPGRYRFAYVADDGRWFSDPHAAPVADDFGRPTSVLTVVKR